MCSLGVSCLYLPEFLFLGMHQISPGLRQNSSIICSTYSEDTVISSSFISHIMFEIIVDIEIGPDCSYHEARDKKWLRMGDFPLHGHVV